MGIKNKNSTPVTWLGSPYVVNLPELKNRQHDVCFYKFVVYLFIAFFLSIILIKIFF